MIYWTRRQNGIPIPADFEITSGFGTAIVIDQETDTAYYITTEGEVRPLGGVKEETFIVVCSSEYGVLTASATVPRVTFRIPYIFALRELSASLTTAQVSGGLVTIDVKAGGLSILSSLITIDNGETTSFSAETPNVLNTLDLETPYTIPKNAEITIFLSALGSGEATGLKVTLIGSAVPDPPIGEEEEV